MTEETRRYMELSILLAQERVEPSNDLTRRIYALRREMDAKGEGGTFWARPQAR